MTKHRAVIAVLVLALTACEKRDQGADLSACKLDELKTNYPEKVSLNKELTAITDAKVMDRYFDYLKKAKVEYLRLCMRKKGWTVNLMGSNCVPYNLEVARCYIPAEPDSD